MTSYFSEVVKDLNDRTEIAKNLLMESEETAEVSFGSIQRIRWRDGTLWFVSHTLSNENKN